MKSRHKKLALIGGALAIIGIIAALVLNALNSNIALYITPTDIAAGKAPQDKIFRIGGVVKEGSISRQLTASPSPSSSPTPKKTSPELQGHPPRPLHGRQRRCRPGQTGRRWQLYRQRSAGQA